MKIAESVTFGGSGLDRCAERRGSLTDQERAAGCYIAFWRGKPLIKDHQFVRLSSDHELMSIAGDTILLGRDEDGFILAHDISSWEPDADLSELDTFADRSEQQHPAADEGAVFAELRLRMSDLTARDAELAATARALFSWHRSHKFCAKCGTASDLAKDGWQRDCPSCGGHHFPRTDPVVIMLVTHGNSVLVGRSHGWPEGMYSLLAGFVEPGETLEAAVRREVFEESGVHVSDVEYLASQPWPYPASLMFGCAAKATTKEINIDPEEIDDAIWLTREELATVFTGQHPKVNPAREGAIAHFLLKNWLADTLD